MRLSLAHTPTGSPLLLPLLHLNVLVAAPKFPHFPIFVWTPYKMDMWNMAIKLWNRSTWRTTEGKVLYKFTRYNYCWKFSLNVIWFSANKTIKKQRQKKNRFDKTLKKNKTITTPLWGLVRFWQVPRKTLQTLSRLCKVELGSPVGHSDANWHLKERKERKASSASHKGSQSCASRVKNVMRQSITAKLQTRASILSPSKAGQGREKKRQSDILSKSLANNTGAAKCIHLDFHRKKKNVYTRLQGFHVATVDS